MGEPITIRYTSRGAQPPVYVTASWTEPPWSVVKMGVTSDPAGGDNKFEKTFHNVKAGEYQYKIRLGEGDWWVVDESVETAFDNYGNRNNVLKVVPKPPAEPAPLTKEQQDPAPPLHRSASAPSEPVTPVAEKPLPFTSVEKVEDQQQPRYGDLNAASLHEDPTKRTSDADPDVEYHTPADTTPELEKFDPNLSTSIVPTVVVEKTDNKLAHGDDFGLDATINQRHAHELRLADFTPDEVIVQTDGNSGGLAEDEDDESAEELDTSSGAEAEDAAPLLRHETFLAQPHTKTSKTVAFSRDDDDDEPAPLFRHETTRFGAANQQSHSKSVTPDEEDEGDVEDDDDEPAPLLRHETTYYNSKSPRRTFETEDLHSNEDDEPAPLFRHETIHSRSTTADLQGDEDVDEDVDEEDEPAPLLRHETKYEPARPGETDSDEGSPYVHDSDDDDEPAPLLRHETIFAKDLKEPYDAQEDSEDDDEPAPLLRHETVFAKHPSKSRGAQEYSDDDDEPAPLLRHETLFAKDFKEPYEAPDDSDDDDIVPLFRHETIRADHHVAKSNTWQDDDDEPTPLFRHESMYVQGHHGNMSDTAVSESFTDRSPVFRGRRTPPYHERSPSRLSGSRSLGQLSDLYPSSSEHAIASDDTSQSPLRRGPGSRSATSLDVPSPSSLDPIAEASPSQERPDPMEEHAQSVSATLDSIVTLPTSLSLPSIRPDLKIFSNRQDSVVDTPADDPAESPGPTVRISKPDSHDNAVTAPSPSISNDGAIGSEVSTIRQRRASPSSVTSRKNANTRGEVAGAQSKKQSLIKALWKAIFDNLFGPIGRWLTHICGGKRNATVVILSLVSVAAVILAISYLPK